MSRTFTAVPTTAVVAAPAVAIPQPYVMKAEILDYVNNGTVPRTDYLTWMAKKKDLDTLSGTVTGMGTTINGMAKSSDLGKYATVESLLQYQPKGSYATQ